MNNIKERLIEIEKILGWGNEQIFFALDLLNDSDLANKNIDKPEFAITMDSNIANLCYEYLDLSSDLYQLQN